MIALDMVFTSHVTENLLNRSTSVMIYRHRASLSEQHTDLLICHCTKQICQGIMGVSFNHNTTQGTRR